MSLSAALTNAIRVMCAPPTMSTDLISATDKLKQRAAYKALMDLDFLKMALTYDMSRPDSDLPQDMDMTPYIDKRALTEDELKDLEQWLDVKGYTCIMKAQQRFIYKIPPCHHEPYWTITIAYK